MSLRKGCELESTNNAITTYDDGFAKSPRTTRPPTLESVSQHPGRQDDKPCDGAVELIEPLDGLSVKWEAEG